MVDIDLDHLAEVVFVRFLHVQLLFTAPPSVPYSLEGRYYGHPTLKGGIAMQILGIPLH